MAALSGGDSTKWGKMIPSKPRREGATSDCCMDLTPEVLRTEEFDRRKKRGGGAPRHSSKDNLGRVSVMRITKPWGGGTERAYEKGVTMGHGELFKGVKNKKRK